MRFRWVVLQLAALEKCSSRYEMDKQLAELPKGLDEIYNRILKNIDEKHYADTRMFLQWLAFCKRPMTVEEIAEAITVDISKKFPVFNCDKWYTDPQDVLVRCSSFVSESHQENGNFLFGILRHLLILSSALGGFFYLHVLSKIYKSSYK